MLRSAFLGALITSSSLFGHWSLEEEMERNLEIFRYYFELGYAPKEWKQELFHWEVDEQIDQLKERILEGEITTNQAYRSLLLDLMRSTHDYHVKVSFLSTKSSSLPFEVMGVENHYYLVHIDRARLPESSFPFAIGDELVEFGGRPTDDVVQEVRERNFPGFDDQTSQSLAEIILTHRSEKRGHRIESGSILLGILPQGEQKPLFRLLAWNQDPEHFGGPEKVRSRHSSSPSLSPLSQIDASFSAFDDLSRKKASHPFSLGAQKSMLPRLGKVIWTSDPSSCFEAYITQTGDRKQIGYLRLPTYHDKEKGPHTLTLELLQILRTFDLLTDGMVIDQMNNPGGSLLVTYALAGMLTDQPLTTPKHRLTLTEEEVQLWSEIHEILDGTSSEEDAQEALGLKLSGYPVDYEFSLCLKNFCEELSQQWKEGKTFSDPIGFFGLDFINPHFEVNYTKPLLVLTNSLDFSCADLFPAILQDNERALIMGTKTAGAGGAVKEHSFPNRLGVDSFSLTWTLAERLDHTPIENRGVTPDLSYSITKEDVLSHFHPFAQEVMDTMKEMIASHNPGL